MQETWQVWEVESANTKKDYETTSIKWTDKKKTNVFCVFCKSDYISRKQVQDHSKEFLGNTSNNNKDFLEKSPFTTIITCKCGHGSDWPLISHYLYLKLWFRQKRRSKVVGTFQKFWEWGTETFSDQSKTQTSCDMAVIDTIQWVSMEKVWLFNVTPLDGI